MGTTNVTKSMALQIPTASGCVEKLAGTVTKLPIRLYRKNGGTVEEELDDIRLRLLNDDTGDTLNANEFWKSMIEDYYFGKGGFAYIQKDRGEFSALRYVDERNISLLVNSEPIFKDYVIGVQGNVYHPFEFLKIRRKTKNGAESIPIQNENPLIFAVAYNSLVYEESMVRKGGNKKGFIESDKKISQNAIDSIKAAWKNLYSNSDDKVVVLNEGAHFKESSNTSVEMQLYENKKANGEEICKLFGFPSSVLTGGATEEDKKEYTDAVVDLLTAIETALDRDLLLEREKGSFYFAFDTRELTRGSQKERFEAYKTALDANFMQIDEVRKAEDLEPLGLNWIRLGLQDVLYDPITKQIYTPNTGETRYMGDSNLPDGDPKAKVTV